MQGAYKMQGLSSRGKYNAEVGRERDGEGGGCG